MGLVLSSFWVSFLGVEKWVLVHIYTIGYT